MEQTTDVKLCPVCRRVLEQIEAVAEDIYNWYCDECDSCYSAELERDPAYIGIPFTQQRPAPQTLTMPAPPQHCKFCQHLLEYDETVRDDYKFWCSGCNATYNEHGKPQPGQWITMRIPDAGDPEPPTPEQIAQLEAVAAAAVSVFTRHGKDLVYMPSAVSRSALKAAVESLIASGWRPS